MRLNIYLHRRIRGNVACPLPSPLNRTVCAPTRKGRTNPDFPQKPMDFIVESIIVAFPTLKATNSGFRKLRAIFIVLYRELDGWKG